MVRCHYCPYESKDSSNMRRHLRGVHSGDGYYCQICSAEFKWVSGLKNKHIITAHNVKRHEKEIHGNVHGDAYNRQSCLKSFNRKDR